MWNITSTLPIFNSHLVFSKAKSNKLNTMPTMAIASWLFLLPLMIMSSSTTFAISNMTTDQSTLVALRNHIISSNAHHFLAQNWSETASVCDWIGVTCGSQRVTALKISGMELTGTIPPLLGNLSFLVSLNLSFNHFSGNLPGDLSGMSRLRSLDFYKNNFTGFIPPSFFNISNLETLIISSNLLRGNIPQQIGNLSNLKVFIGGVNRFSGAIPSGIGRLRMLQLLYLGTNMLQGPIPEELSNLENLQEIRLDNNGLSGSIPAGLFNISTLQIISLSVNNLSGTLPSSMAAPNLVYLDLQINNLTGKIPDSISNSSNLFQVTLQRNKLTGSIPNSFGNLKHLDCLHLFGNQLTNDAPNQPLSFLTALTNCPKLRDLVVSFNPLRGSLPPSIGNLSTSLIRVHISGCMLTGSIPDEIGNLSYLNNLNIQDNEFTGSVPITIRGMRRLQGLSLSGNNIQGPLPESLCDLPELSNIKLAQNQISGPIPECLGNMTSLRKIDLASNRLNSAPPLSLWKLRDLMELNLSSNSLSGDLPHEIQNLRVATYINLSANEFTGAIPNAFGSMLDLIVFSLASNKLEGSIPESMGKMISLVSLDLSDNALTGEIPRVLEDLQLLTYFNVSFNKLSGEIPSGGNFKNFSYSFFASNGALCGTDHDHEQYLPRCRSRNRGSRGKFVLIVSVTAGSLLFLITALSVLSWTMRRRRGATAESETKSSYDSSSVVMERFSYQQLKQATGDFSDSNLLGSGSFGSVYLANFENGMHMAVKVFDLRRESASKSFETECDMLSNLRHRNLTKVISTCSNLDFKALLLEYMQNGSLDDWLYGEGRFLDMVQRMEVMIDVASALEYLHHGYVKPVIHCDLKPSNILLDRDMVGHVTDFGITKLLGEEDSIVHTQTLATLGYMAPEYGIEGVVSSACDVYSYGIVLMETFTRKRPTDDMFGGEVSLRSWINTNLVSQVVDSTLLMMMKEEGDDDDEHFTEIMQCVSSIFELAMACTVESPKDRMNMKNVVTALEKIKLHFISTLGSTQGC